MRLRYSALLAVVGLVMVCGVSHAQVVTNFTATINACQVETAPDPCGVSNAVGTGTFVLTETGVEAENTLSFHIEFSGLTSATTNGHIHGPAAVGLSAGVVRGFPANGPPGTHVSPIDGVWRFTDSQPLTNVRVQQLKDQLFYVNIHTSGFPSGEIRGQIVPVAVPVTAGTWGALKKIYR